MAALRILFLARAVDATTEFGDAIHVRAVVSELAALGHTVHLACLGDPAQEGALAGSLGKGCTVTLFPTRGVRRLYHPRQVLATWTALGVARTRGFDAVYARPSVGPSGTFDAWTELLVSRLASVPLALEINGWAEDDAAVRGPSPFARLAGVSRRGTRAAFSRAEGFVAVNESLAARLVERLRVRPDAVLVVKNAADPRTFRPGEGATARAALGLPADVPVLVFVGHVGHEADLDPVLRAVPRLRSDFPGLRLVVVGSGEDLVRYRGLAAELGASEAVAFAGRVPHDRVPPYLQAADLSLVAIKPHLVSTPLKLFESWACGKAVVATDLPDHRLILDVGGGVLASPHTAEGWAEAVSTLLRDPQRAAEMGRKGLAYVREEHTWGRVAERIAAMLQRLRTAGSPGGPSGPRP